MSSLKLISLALIVFTLAACITAKPIYNVVEKNNTTAHPSAAQVKKAIITAVKYKAWTVKKEQPGTQILDIAVGDHYAEIAVPYSAQGDAINYVASRKLEAKDNKIHRNYSKWIVLLEQQIDAYVSYE